MIVKIPERHALLMKQFSQSHPFKEVSSVNKKHQTFVPAHVDVSSEIDKNKIADKKQDIH